MILNWFKTFNKDAFDAKSLISRTETFTFDGKGDVDLTLFKGTYYSIIVDNVMLSLNMSGNNPFVFESRGIYIDGNNDIWIGYAP